MRKGMRKYLAEINRQIGERQEKRLQLSEEEMIRYLNNEVHWKKEIDPSLAKVGMDCTVWTPERPWWDGLIVGEPFDWYRLKFEVSKEEKPRMGGDYLVMESLGPSQDIKYLWQEKVLPVIQKTYGLFKKHAQK